MKETWLSEQVKKREKEGEGLHLWGFERVLLWERDVEEEDTSVIRRVRWPHNGGNQLINIVSLRAS